MSWIKVCSYKSLQNGDLLDFDYDDKKILISKLKGKLYATDRICTHAYADLSNGIVNEDELTVTCPLHLSAFKMNDGIPQNLPADEPLKVYNIKVENDVVYVDI